MIFLEFLEKFYLRPSPTSMHTRHKNNIDDINNRIGS